MIGETSPSLTSVFLYFTNNDREVDMDSWMIQFHNPLEIRNAREFFFFSMRDADIAEDNIRTLTNINLNNEKIPIQLIENNQ